MTIPLIVVTVLLLIATLSMPAVIRLPCRRARFPAWKCAAAERRYGSLGRALWTTLVCLVLLIVTLPLRLVPPFFALDSAAAVGLADLSRDDATTRSHCTPRATSGVRSCGVSACRCF